MSYKLLLLGLIFVLQSCSFIPIYYELKFYERTGSYKYGKRLSEGWAYLSLHSTYNSEFFSYSKTEPYKLALNFQGDDIEGKILTLRTAFVLLENGEKIFLKTKNSSPIEKKCKGYSNGGGVCAIVVQIEDGFVFKENEKVKAIVEFEISGNKYIHRIEDEFIGIYKKGSTTVGNFRT